jgi:transitional endoplasmic reticulum ATPase
MSSDLTSVIVKESKPQDVSRGIVRVDPLIIDALKINVGDAIQIIGKENKKTAALAWPGLPEDKAKTIIRMDPATRRNIRVGIDERVHIKKIEIKLAQSITLAPTTQLFIEGGESFIRTLLEGRCFTPGDMLELLVMGNSILFQVSTIIPRSEAVMVTQGTEIILSDKPSIDIPTFLQPKISYDTIGGLREEIQKVREMIELPLKYPELFERLGVEAPKGVLLHGPPGTGKTMLAKAVANETDCKFFIISGPEIMSKFYGESEENLRNIFEDAQKNAPSILFVDEIDSIAPKREDSGGEVERRVVAQLLALMDGLQNRGQVVVIGATNLPNNLDPALRRGGRFDREIEIGIPNRASRNDILQIHCRGMPLAPDVSLESLATVTHGYVGADLATLAKEAAMISLREIIPQINLESDSIPGEILEKITITKDHFSQALLEVQPSGLREVFVDVPNITWQDIGGLESVKKDLIKAVEWPLKYPEIYSELKAKPPKGILLYGPPGTGKTLLAKAVAHESQSNFISIKGPEFLSKWVGESEKAVRETFRKARQAAPCIIFFDEIETIVPTRGQQHSSTGSERIVSQLLTEMDGLEELNGVLVIAATNRPDIIDPALLRPGRFDKKIEIGLPSLMDIISILQVCLKNKYISEEIDLDILAKQLLSKSGADISAFVNETFMIAIQRYVEARSKSESINFKDWKILKSDFDQAYSIFEEQTVSDKKYEVRSLKKSDSSYI